MEVSCISTGQVYVDGGLTLTEENGQKRKQAINVFKEIIDLAARFAVRPTFYTVRTHHLFNGLIKIYWIKHTNKEKIVPLTWIQQKYAYGLKYLKKSLK